MKITVLDYASLGYDLDLSVFEKFGSLEVFEKSEVMGGDDIVNQPDMESNGDSED